MSHPRPDSMRKQWTAVGAVMVLAWAGFHCFDLRWGLPGWQDAFLFGDRKPWPGNRVAELMRADQRWSADRGSDVDRDPIASSRAMIPLNDTDEKRAAIILRYRLYTHQPDEMTVLMALRSMRPDEGDFDPKLYQYGGLFLYPVGALIRLSGAVGLVTIQSDLAWYLDRPEEFGRLYVVARAYVAAWGLVGLFIVFALGRRLARGLGAAGAAGWAGVAAALVYVGLPVVVNMAHEAKPHLPAAVLMLAAVLAAVRYVDRPGWRRAAMGGVVCGAAFGMVLSSWPIFVVIPLMTIVRPMRVADRLRHAWIGVAAGVLTYGVTNPYIPINLVRNRAVLRSNFGNSLAMYEVHRLGEGFRNVVTLMGEGMSFFVLASGLLATIVAALLLCRARRTAAQETPTPAGDTHVLGLLLAPAALVFLQFVALGAGKPGEYGRFALFPDIVLATVAASVAVSLPLRRARAVVRGLIVLLCVGNAWAAGAAYQIQIRADAEGGGTRREAALMIRNAGDKLGSLSIGVFTDPAPYCMPPVDLFRHRLLRMPRDATPEDTPSLPDLVVTTTDDMTDAPVDVWRRRYRDISPPARGRPARISWANKPFVILLRTDLYDAWSR